MLACALVTALIVPLSSYLTGWGSQYWHGNIEQLFTRFELCFGRACLYVTTRRSPPVCQRACITHDVRHHRRKGASRRRSGRGWCQQTPTAAAVTWVIVPWHSHGRARSMAGQIGHPIDVGATGRTSGVSAPLWAPKARKCTVRLPSWTSKRQSKQNKIIKARRRNALAYAPDRAVSSENSPVNEQSGGGRRLERGELAAPYYLGPSRAMVWATRL